jgi:hypothetical protein
MKVRMTMTTAALAASLIGVAVPAASAAGPADVVARFVAGHQAPDAIGRWLATGPVDGPVAAAPVSDVESSLKVERWAVAGQPAPISDVASSSQVARDTVAAAQPTPVSDVVSSLHSARNVAAASLATATNSGGFVWQDAGIGAGAALLLIAIAISSLTLMRRHRHLTA